MEDFGSDKRMGSAGLDLPQWARILLAIFFFPIGLIFLWL
jgi:hypothetical protein